MAMASRAPKLIAAFEPECITLDLATVGPEGLRSVALKKKWKCVLSLLDDPGQAMDADDEGSAEASCSEGRLVNLSASERIAADVLMELDSEDAQ